MEGLLVTHRGLEDVALLEVKEILKKKGKKLPSATLFSMKSLDEAAKLCYLSQSAKRILIYLDTFKVGKLEQTVDTLKEIFKKNLG